MNKIFSVIIQAKLLLTIFYYQCSQWKELPDNKKRVITRINFKKLHYANNLKNWINTCKIN